MSRLLLIAGRARVGKDTFARTSNDLFGYMPCIAFADALKEEINDEMVRRYDISAFTQDPKEKSVIRPHLVELGRKRRAEDVNHWVKKVEPEVKEWLEAGETVLVTDNRYANEARWGKALGGKVLYIERIQEDGRPVPPANDEEAANDAEVRALADYVLSWGESDYETRARLVKTAWRELFGLTVGEESVSR